MKEYLRATIEVFQNKTRESWESSQEMPKLEQDNACKCAVACEDSRWPESSRDWEGVGRGRTRVVQMVSFRWEPPGVDS
jgi:hypothetical protein